MPDTPRKIEVRAWHPATGLATVRIPADSPLAAVLAAGATAYLSVHTDPVAADTAGCVTAPDELGRDALATTARVLAASNDRLASQLTATEARMAGTLTALKAARAQRDDSYEQVARLTAALTEAGEAFEAFRVAVGSSLGLIVREATAAALHSRSFRGDRAEYDATPYRKGTNDRHWRRCVIAHDPVGSDCSDGTAFSPGPVRTASYPR